MWTRPHLLGLVAVGAVAIPAALAAPADAAPKHDVTWISGTAGSRSAAIFRLEGVRPRTVVRATLVRGATARRLPVRSVRSGARRGVLRVSRSRGRLARLRLVVDRRAPHTRITARPARATPVRSARVRFASNERGSTFECRIDGGPWARCSSPGAYAGLQPGVHTVLVRATDRARNVERTPARAAWTVTAGPTRPACCPMPLVPATAEAAPTTTPTLSDTGASDRVDRTVWEPRALNSAANRRTPTDSELTAYRSAANDWGRCNSFHTKVTGGFTGTTDEIIQWAAAKWGFEPELFRAVAVVESYWRQSEVGDNGQSFGLMQVKRTAHSGTFPLSRDSTAFNADFYGAILRHYFDGCAEWLNDVERGKDYVKGDLWGSVGAWFAGRWYTPNADGYIAKVKGVLQTRTWLQPTF